ncbi:MAG: type IV toxin-antitoxin system AbiEi family antitoxin domain-containing protein [Solirubrobacterales bacterium]
MRQKPSPPEGAIARIAARQHGVITAAQLAAAGFDASAVARRVRSGRLHRIHRGVYAVGQTSLGEKGRWTAAVLACGEGAVLSHASAAALWGFLLPRLGPVDVTLPSRSYRRHGEIRIHRPRRLASRDWMVRAEIRVTTPRRTIADCRQTLPDYLVRAAAREAQHAGYSVTLDRTRSDLELDFATFCRRHRLPPPEINIRIDLEEDRWLTADFLWRSVHLVVETDSYLHHQGDVSFEDDHARDLALRRLGFTVLRYTGRQLEREGRAIADELRQLLAPPRQTGSRATRRP